MVEKWVITIDSVNQDGEIDRVYYEDDNFVGASRLLYTYKPKRNYMVVKYTIERDWRLF